MRQSTPKSTLQGDQIISPATMQSAIGATLSETYPCQGLDSLASQPLPSPLSTIKPQVDFATSPSSRCALKYNQVWSLQPSEAYRLGKRARSTSSASSSDLSLSDGASSSWPSSSSSSNQNLDSPATPPFGQSSDDENERRRGSPSTMIRKTMRCSKQDTACTAPMSKQCLETSVSTSAILMELDVARLGSDISSFGLSSQEPSPEQATAGNITTASSRSSIVDHLMGEYSAHDGQLPVRAFPLRYHCLCDSILPSNLADHCRSHHVNIPVTSDAAVATVDHIWPLPVGVHCSASSFPLHLFIRETIRRSRTSCSTLQAALLYCVRSGPAVKALRSELMGGSDTPADFVKLCIRLDQSKQLHPLLCGRRIFLASIMVASKFLQDKNYSNQAWSKITGLPVKELGMVEREFLKAIDWQLYIQPGSWERWTKTLREPKADASSHSSSVASTAAAAGHSHPVAAGPSVSSQPLPAAVNRLKAEVDRSATPTLGPSAPARSALARSQSDAAPFRPYDVVVTAPAPTASELASCQVKSSPLSVESSSSTATPTLASSSSSRDTTDESALVTSFEPSSTVLGPLGGITTPAAPYPMHRSFVRSAASFSAVGVDRMEMMIKTSSD